jgi:hypothetical protein
MKKSWFAINKEKLLIVLALILHNHLVMVKDFIFIIDIMVVNLGGFEVLK